MKKILSIAGSDCSGGAGIQADIKTITAHNMYAMSVLTALTAQNTMGVWGVIDVSPSFVGQQIDAVFSDIYPDALKIGMVSNKNIIEVIVEKLKKYKPQNVVLDPVMLATSGGKLLKSDAAKGLIEELIPLVTIVTPNIPEAELLSNIPIYSKKEMLLAAKELKKSIKGHILIKGGHLDDCSDDLLVTNENYYWFEHTHIPNPNTHGTGCTLSSAIACNLAAGMPIENSVQAAKKYVTGALNAHLNLGKGNGPLNHCWNFKK